MVKVIPLLIYLLYCVEVDGIFLRLMLWLLQGTSPKWVKILHSWWVSHPALLGLSFEVEAWKVEYLPSVFLWDLFYPPSSLVDTLLFAVDVAKATVDGLVLLHLRNDLLRTHGRNLVINLYLPILDCFIAQKICNLHLYWSLFSQWLGILVVLHPRLARLLFSFKSRYILFRCFGQFQGISKKGIGFLNFIFDFGEFYIVEGPLGHFDFLINPIFSDSVSHYPINYIEVMLINIIQN